MPFDSLSDLILDLSGKLPLKVYRASIYPDSFRLDFLTGSRRCYPSCTELASLVAANYEFDKWQLTPFGYGLLADYLLDNADRLSLCLRSEISLTPETGKHLLLLLQDYCHRQFLLLTGAA